MTTADRAQDDLRTAAAAVAAARPEPFPRWVPPAVTVPFVAGFVALAVTSWTGQLAWLVAGLALLLVFFAVLFLAVLRMRVRVRPPRGWRRNVFEYAVIAVGLLLFLLVDQGAGLLVVGLGLAVPMWLQFSRQGRA